MKNKPLQTELSGPQKVQHLAFFSTQKIHVLVVLYMPNLRPDSVNEIHARFNVITVVT